MQTGLPELLAAWCALSKTAEKILFFLRQQR